MENTKELMLSMVVPIYNQEKYLRECLDSLLHQDVAPETYEIICVNDGSTDSSLQILEEYAEQFSNIRIIDKTNGGVSSARNAGIDAAQGKYLWFIDSDDYIKENFLGHLFESFRLYNPDSVFVLAADEKRELTYEKFIYGYDIYNVSKFSFSVWANIKKFSLIKDLRFSTDMKYSEDAYYETEFYLLSSSGKHVCIWDKVYYYRQNPQGACKTINQEKKVNDLLKMAEFVQCSIKNNELLDEKRKVLVSNMYRTVWAAMRFLPETSLNYKTTMKRIKSSGLKLPLCWGFPVWNKTVKVKLIRFVSRLFSIPPLYYIYFLIKRARYKIRLRK